MYARYKTVLLLFAAPIVSFNFKLTRTKFILYKIFGNCITNTITLNVILVFMQYNLCDTTYNYLQCCLSPVFYFFFHLNGSLKKYLCHNN